MKYLLLHFILFFEWSLIQKSYNYRDSDHFEQNYEYFHCYGSLRRVEKPALMMLLIKFFSSCKQYLE